MKTYIIIKWLFYFYFLFFIFDFIHARAVECSWVKKLRSNFTKNIRERCSSEHLELHLNSDLGLIPICKSNCYFFIYQYFNLVLHPSDANWIHLTSFHSSWYLDINLDLHSILVFTAYDQPICHIDMVFWHICFYSLFLFTFIFYNTRHDVHLVGLMFIWNFICSFNIHKRLYDEWINVQEVKNT